MSNVALAYKGYASTTKNTGSNKSIEIKVFTNITSRLASIDANEPGGFALLAEALHENFKLWTILAEDVASEDNALPDELRKSIFQLADFSRKHTYKVLDGSATVDVLVDINKSIIAGLQGISPKTYPAPVAVAGA